MPLEVWLGLIIANMLIFIILYCDAAYPGVITEQRGDVTVHYPTVDEKGRVISPSSLIKIILFQCVASFLFIILFHHIFNFI